jgi:undecaprenyl-diphosphatase
LAATTSADRYPHHHRRSLLVASALLFAATVALWAVARGGPLIDEFQLTLRLKRAMLHTEVDQVTQFVLNFGTAPVAFATVALGACIAWRRVGGRAALLVLAASGVVLVTAAAKSILGPTLAYEQILQRVTDSFPSGHVSYATAVFGAFAWLGWSHRVPELAGVALLLILLTGPSTVIRGGHVPSDVLAGYLVGGGWLLLCLAATATATARRPAREES